MRDRTVRIEMLKAIFGLGSSGTGVSTMTALLGNRMRIGNGRNRNVVVLTPKRGTRLGKVAEHLIIGRISAKVRG